MACLLCGEQTSLCKCRVLRQSGLLLVIDSGKSGRRLFTSEKLAMTSAERQQVLPGAEVTLESQAPRDL
jgi:hypothetical protein